MLKYIVSWLAGFCKGTVFFDNDMAQDIFPKKDFNDMTDEERERCLLWMQGVCMFAHRSLREGDTLQTNMQGMTHKGRDVGSFRVTIERLSEPKAG